MTDAQEVVTDDVAGSGMAQGEALINVRSDIKLGIKATRGTKSAYMDQLTEVIADQMGAARACYADIVKTRPATVGSLAMRVTLDPGEPPKLEVKEQEGSDEQLTSCIRKVFERAKYKGVGLPAAAIVTLEFQNTRARGQAVMTDIRTETEKVDVRQGDGGGFEADYTTPDGRVSFRVTSKNSAPAVEASMRTLRDSFAGFLDCRRRAQKDGLSPVGELDVAVRLQQGGKASGTVKNSTVAHPRVIPCVERAVGRLKFDGAPAGRPVRLQITFGP